MTLVSVMITSCEDALREAPKRSNHSTVLDIRKRKC